MEALLREREVCALLGVTRMTLFALRKQGEIAHVKVGRNVRYTQSAISAYVERNTRLGNAEANETKPEREGEA